MKTHQLLGPLHLGHLVLIPLLEGQGLELGLAVEVGQQVTPLLLLELQVLMKVRNKQTIGDPVVEEALTDAPGLEDEILYPGMFNTTMKKKRQTKTISLQNFQIQMLMRCKRIMKWELLKMQMRTDLS